MYSGKFLAQLLIDHAIERPGGMSFEESVMLYTPPFVASLAVVVIFVFVYKVDTPHYYKLSNSIYVL